MEPSASIENTPYRAKYRWTEDFRASLPASELKRAIEKILAGQRLLEAFRESPLFHTRIDAGSFLPLTIAKQERHINIGHYFKRGCDTYADPAMEFEIGKDGAWYPVSVELANGDCRFCTDGPFRLDFEERRKQVSFAAKWSADLLAQDYERGDVLQPWSEND